jgi:beta-lactam-binding protein with PASTA domain
MRARPGCLWALLVLGVVALSFVGGMVAFNFIMAYSVRHGAEMNVPPLTGLTVEQAEGVARDQNLRVRLMGERFSPTVPTGIILEQSPPASRRVKKGRRISVIVSGGVETTQVPAVSGAVLRQATVLLDRAGLDLGHVAEIYSDGYADGVVVSTSPGPGTVLEKGSRVDLLVSRGRLPLRFPMPDLVGRDAEAAQERLEALGVVVLHSREFHRAGRSDAATVLSQRPEAGYEITEGDTVRLVIGSH